MVAEAELREFDRLCRWLASRYYAPGLTRDDLEQEARIGVWEALSREDIRPETRGGLVRTVAERRVIDAVKLTQREKRRSLNEAVSLDAPVKDDDSETFYGSHAGTSPDPLSEVLRREEIDGVLTAVVRANLTELEETVLLEIAQTSAGETAQAGTYDRLIAAGVAPSRKAIDNALQRARKKVRRQRVRRQRGTAAVPPVSYSRPMARQGPPAERSPFTAHRQTITLDLLWLQEAGSEQQEFGDRICELVASELEGAALFWIDDQGPTVLVEGEPAKPEVKVERVAKPKKKKPVELATDGEPLTHKDLVRRYIRDHGPSTWTEIRKGTGIPNGSRGECLGTLEFRGEIVKDGGRPARYDLAPGSGRAAVQAKRDDEAARIKRVADEARSNGKAPPESPVTVRRVDPDLLRT